MPGQTSFKSCRLRLDLAALLQQSKVDNFRHVFEYAKTSDGEYLCGYLFDRMVDSGFWDRLQDKHLLSTGRSQGFRTFLQEALALNLVRRLILAGEHVKSQVDVSDAGFLSYLEPFINRWGLRSLNAQGQLARLVRGSVAASNHDIGERLRDHMLQWARTEHRHCYLCGNHLTFNPKPGAPKYDDVTLDHLWPQAYGGDSVEKNILPACRACNHEKKRDFPTWAGCNIHTLTIGMDPSEEDFKSVGQHFRFALYNRAVKRLANIDRITLRQAYQQVGPWLKTPWFLDDEDVGDYFNLANYDPAKTKHGILLVQVP